MMRKNRMGRFLRIALMAAGWLALFSFFVMELWNWLAPPIFGWHRINFLQAVGLLVLSKILFGGLRGGWDHRGHWHRRMRERWEELTPEEREKLRKGMMGCCVRPQATSDPETSLGATFPAGER